MKNEMKNEMENEMEWNELFEKFIKDNYKNGLSFSPTMDEFLSILNGMNGVPPYGDTDIEFLYELYCYILETVMEEVDYLNETF